MSVPARPAVLQAFTETETEEGGRIRTWSDVATIWASLVARTGASDAAQEMRPVRVETADAAARDHPAAAAGQQLVFDGDLAPWRVLAVRRDDPAPGRMTLALDRASS